MCWVLCVHTQYLAESNEIRNFSEYFLADFH
jgi:hypothetical protein